MQMVKDNGLFDVTDPVHLQVYPVRYHCIEIYELNE